MKQVLQSLRSGDIEIADVPCPAPAPGQLLIRTRKTLVSAGTERMLLDFGRGSWLDKARQQPDKVRMVLDKVRTDGLLPTLETIRNKLDQPIALGYCNVGNIVAVGGGVQGFEIGDRVVSNGKHAELVSVPVNLCARVPDSVEDEAATFTVLGAIALQGIRLVQPTLGECVVVTGLGLIGLVTVQLLRANGCRVLGLDFDASRLARARESGAETFDLSSGGDPMTAANEFSRGRGVDAVIVTASTQSSEPIHQAATMCRKRGRIVLVGVTGLELSRADFYEKEVTFQVSCSYGPGRYDPDYEERGRDYPYAFVRWTEQRNFEAVLDMMASGRLAPESLVTHRFPIAAAARAYEVVGGSEPSLGIVLEFPHHFGVGDHDAVVRRSVELSAAAAPKATGVRPVVSAIGAGNYATNMLLPAFRAAGARLRRVASAGGLTAVQAGRKLGFESATTDVTEVLDDPQAQVVVVSTRHDSHARYVVAALEAGKHVFVEKPLCLTAEEQASIETAHARSGRLLMVGYNRRFASQVRTIARLLAPVPGPKSFVVTVNAGAIPASHWAQDQEVGGGRILGEACHFVDLLRHLAGVAIVESRIDWMDAATRDTATIVLRFADGSLGAVHYFANGSKAFPKERLEVFVAGRVLQLDNFRRLTGYGWPGFRNERRWRQDKGQVACVGAFLEAVKQGGSSPIPPDEVFEVSRVMLQLVGR
jgi:predicted dehydrogenase/threonine dehydrogenase-like Zn-dependent dehydrogenase